MARTPLLDGLQRAMASIDEEGTATTRRTFLSRAGAATAGAMVAGLPVRSAFAATPGPRIVVVGAGLAGLIATYRLQQAGYAPQLHEASNRAGGRCWTIRGAFADGQVAEHGGELIDSNHIAMKQLVSELGFKLDNLFQDEPNGSEPITYFDGRPYTWDDATNDLKGIYQQIHSDVSAASYPTTYLSSTERGRELDKMSLAAYLAKYVAPASSKLAQLLDVAYNIEYGAETSQQSSLNMLYLLGYSGQGNLRIFGPSNEKFHVEGGNDQVSTSLAKKVGSALTFGSELKAVVRNADGTYKLSFLQGTTTKSVTADHVVLALPFSILRSSVDISRAGFTDVKKLAINELGMGTNSKLNVGFKSRHWRTLGGNGDTYADTGYQATWEVSRAQPGTSGILVDYTGGTIGTTFGADSPQVLAQRFLRQIEPVLPGITAKWDGRATVDSWPDYKWTKGSYSYFKPGQYTKFAGAEAEASGTCHFAGEHTSQDFQGYLNGAVESGERACDEILADLKK